MKKNKKAENERLPILKNAMQQMIATSDDAYNYINGFTRAKTYQNYSREQVEQIIASGDPNSLKELSNSFLYASGYYRRMMFYYATILTYNTLLVPNFPKENLTSQMINRFEDALDYLDSFKIPTNFIYFAMKVLVDGAYYGMITVSSDGTENIVTLPFEYCRSRFKSYDGVALVEFDLSYFDKIFLKEKRIACLKTYPKEIREAYNLYKNRNGERWYLIPTEFGIHFKLYEERPFLSDIIPAIMDFEDYRVIEKQKDTMDLKKIIAQEMPHLNDGELVFEPEEVETMHAGLVGMVGKSEGLDVVTSFGKVNVYDLQSNRSVISNNLEKISDSIYSEAGVNKQIFSASNNTALNRSIENDTALMMFLATQFKDWLQYRVNYKFEGGGTSFNLVLLPITRYNQETYYKNAINAAQYGYSFLVPAIALGFTQREFINLKKLENNYLGLKDIMTPLQSANTQSGDKGEAGREPKNETELADQTMKNKNAGG